MKANDQGFSWGYGDKEVFSYSLQHIAEKNLAPRLDIYMTLTTHEPFNVPEPQYRQRFEQKMNTMPAGKKEELMKYRGVFECLLYTDDAIRNFIEAYKNRPDYRHTIFIITGDHRMIPVPHKNSIDRFHVPFLIWSPMLKQPATFRGISSHHSVAPSVMAFLKKNYGLDFPAVMPFIGDKLDMSTTFRGVIEQPIMQNKGDLGQYVMNDYFYNDGALFRIKPHMELDRVTDAELLQQVERKLENFKAINTYVCRNNKLYYGPKTEGTGLIAYELTPEEKDYLYTTGFDTLGTDDKYFMARERSFSGKYREAIIILKETLNGSPNYGDVRILLGRTYFWSGDTANARKEMREAIRRSPDYYDAYVALADLETREGNRKEALKVTEQGLSVLKDNEELLERRKKLQP
jgi:lipoteichoic acid synthase